MGDEERDTTHLESVEQTHNHDQRHPQAILQSSRSIIADENSNAPQNSIEVLDRIYSDRTHRKCIHISYLTLISMTLAVTVWIFYWIAWNRCENIKDPRSVRFVCDLTVILETITFIFVGMSPVLFLIMVFSWIRYSCHNPMDAIREDKKLLKIERIQWEKQLNYYYQNKKLRCLNCCYRKQRNELNERGYGYVILSSHGIVVDELILFSARKEIIDQGVLSDGKRLLKLTFKRTWTRPWKTHISVYLPENSDHRPGIEELTQLLKIQIIDQSGSSISL